ncbi:MAG: hypothetical protein VX899_24555 [Myxococcota bacterium]|nr:hypothetical protein [Myxococcota bacterium]
MAKLEVLERDTWEEAVNAPVAMILLGKTTCAACNAWTEELESFLEEDSEFGEVRFAKILLDKGGLGKWKKATPWLGEVNDLPTNVIYVNGEPVKRWAGNGTDRMANRLRRYTQG